MFAFETLSSHILLSVSVIVAGILSLTLQRCLRSVIMVVQTVLANRQLAKYLAVNGMVMIKQKVSWKGSAITFKMANNNGN